MMLDRLKQKNPGIEIFSVDSEEFKSFGRIIDTVNPDEIIAAAGKTAYPESGSCYKPSEESFEKLSIAEEIRKQCFGELPAQIGYCFGHNNMLNATEWHTSSEINVAVTPLVLILGHIWDIKDNRIDSSEFKAFYLPKGTVAEVYATSLHFCPCEVESSGFGCMVALPEGTNVPLDGTPSDPLLFRKNKWLLSHVDNEGLIARGAVAGITGENYEIRY